MVSFLSYCRAIQSPDTEDPQTQFKKNDNIGSNLLLLPYIIVAK